MAQAIATHRRTAQPRVNPRVVIVAVAAVLAIAIGLLVLPRSSGGDATVPTGALGTQAAAELALSLSRTTGPAGGGETRAILTPQRFFQATGRLRSRETIS